MKSRFLSAAALLALTTSVGAAVVSESISYQHGDTQLEGQIYYDDASSEKRPGVLVVHEWWGLDDYAKTRASMLAELGYVAFAADMYGKGKVTEHPDQAKEWMMVNAANVPIWRERAGLALQQLKQHPMTDRDKTAAIGYCFGGATVVELAYSGADLDGVASFHGSLPLPIEGETPDLKAPLLLLHGHSDPFVEKAHVEKFRERLTALEADWEMVEYGGALHSFTNPAADQHGMPALKYDAAADRRSWARLQQFFAEIFAD
jgi:dienelactone hydrolase